MARYSKVRLRLPSCGSCGRVLLLICFRVVFGRWLRELVEGPLLEHLSLLGWETLVWSERGVGDRVGRWSDRDVLLGERLGSALVRINRGPDGLPWLDDVRVKEAVAELRSMPAGVRLLEANRVSTGLLLGGVAVAGLDGWDGGRDRTIDYIDWDNWSANDFLAVSRLRHRAKRRTFGLM